MTVAAGSKQEDIIARTLKDGINLRVVRAGDAGHGGRSQHRD